MASAGIVPAYLTSGTLAKSCRAVELVPMLPPTLAGSFPSRRILSGYHEH